MRASESTSPQSLIYLQLLIGMSLFGSTTPISKIVSEAFPVFTASLMRMTIAAIALAPFMAPHLKEPRLAGRRDWLVIALIALVGMVGFTATMLFGMRLTTGVIGATVMSSTPAVTALASVVFLGAAMNWRKAGALGLAVVGVVAINLMRDMSGEDGGRAVILGAALVGLAVCFEAAYTLLSKLLSDGVSSVAVTFAATLMALPAFALLALLLDPNPYDISGASMADWGAVLFWGAATGALAPVIWYTGVRQAPGPLAASFMAVMPLSALTLSYVLLGEAFRWAHLVGFGAVCAGVLLMVWEHASSGHEH